MSIMNHTIAIVDDEPNLVEALYDLLRKKLPQDVEILRAYSATEFCNLLIHTSVDIAVSDILMPGITGIDMLDKVERLCPGCRIIFLTGYEKFSWAQEALRHPCCVDYLLKTAGFDAMVEAVTKQLTIIERKNALETIKENLNSTNISKDEDERTSNIREWIIGNEIDIPEQIQDTENRCMIVFLCRRVCIGNLEGLFPNVIEQLFSENFIMQSAIHVVGCKWQEEYVCLAQFVLNQVNEDSTGPFIRARIAHIQETLENLQEKVDIAYHTDFRFASEVPTVYNELHRQLDNRYAGHSSAIIDCTHIDAPLQPDNSLIDQICSYIMANLSNHNLSVALIASATYYSPAHLNRLFKKEQGISLSDYIIQMRMQAACQYLTDSMLDVAEIGKKIGFESPSYFGVVFKRNMGVTPSDWRHGKRKETLL